MSRSKLYTHQESSVDIAMILYIYLVECDVIAAAWATGWPVAAANTTTADAATSTTTTATARAATALLWFLIMLLLLSLLTRIPIDPVKSQFASTCRGLLLSLFIIRIANWVSNSLAVDI